MRASCDRCGRDLPSMPGLVRLPCAHVDQKHRPCLDGYGGSPWHRPFGGSARNRYAQAYIGSPGKYDPAVAAAAAIAEWDL